MKMRSPLLDLQFPFLIFCRRIDFFGEDTGKIFVFGGCQPNGIRSVDENFELEVIGFAGCIVPADKVFFGNQ